MTTTKIGRPRRDRSKWNAKAFEAARVRRKLSMQALAALVGVHASTIHRWEGGVPPHDSYVPAIAKALRVTQKSLAR